jgi:vitamin B12/bleomycin/antimicrobial peptide transport system ATP-binding/permease protein
MLRPPLLHPHPQSLTPAMSTPTPAETGAFQLDWRVAKRFLHFAGGYWTGSTARQAFLLTAGLAASLLLSTYVTVQLNEWNRLFFDALERRDVASVKHAVLVFFAIIAAMAAIGVGIVYTRMSLQVRWRQWVVERLLGQWLAKQKFYHLNATGREPANPEYRISDDTRWATEILVDLGIGLLTAVVGGIAFITILWNVGGGFRVGNFNVPGYMVWCALAYGVAASALTAWVGRPLVGRVGQKNEAEGYFRFAMMRLRDNAESVALAHGASAESRILRGFYDTVVARWLKIVRSYSQLTWITNATGPMIPIVPLLFAAPKYLAGDLTLGQVTQLAAAFVQVQQAISWIVDNYQRIADWYASARRVMDIVDATDAIEGDLPAPRPAPTATTGAALVLDRVALRDAAGRALLLPVSLTLARGDAVHVAGPSNTGKSTLARILAGLVTPSGGSIAGAGSNNVLLLPQKSYLPLGTLADAIAYPSTGLSPASPELTAALDAVGLSALAPRLNETARWDQVLSASDRQRLAAARVVIAKPQILVMDDALSALDGAAQKSVIGALRVQNPGLTILSLGQRAAPAGVFDRTLELTRHEQDVMVSEMAR